MVTKRLSDLQAVILKTFHELLDNDIKKKIFVKKTIQMGWDEEHPFELDAQRWVGNTAKRYADKRMTKLREGIAAVTKRNGALERSNKWLDRVLKLN